MAKNEMYGLINQGPWREANNFVTQDNTPGTGIVQSPTVVTNAVVTALTVPDHAVELMIYSDAALRISEEATCNDRYFIMPAASMITVNVASMVYVYLLGDAGNCNVQFMFSEI